MGIYDPLRDYLANCGSDEVTLSFADIEAILGRTLPPSAGKYGAWWANSGDSPLARHSHARAWCDAGYLAQADRAGGTVRFYRPEAAAPADGAAIQLHRLFAGLPRYNWRNIDEIPFRDGICIVYERGETYRGYPRVVRVGANASPGRLGQRLRNQFVREDHNGSAFRRDIGKAMLNRDQDPYIAIWSLDTSRTPNPSDKSRKLEAQIERRVSAYMRKSLTFSIVPVEDGDERSRLEGAVVATLRRAEDFGPSDGWLGHDSPEREIRDSGLWLRQGPVAEPLSPAELRRLSRIIASAAEAATPRSRPELKAGDRIRHDSFGDGAVLSVRPVGHDALIEADFGENGRRKLMLCAAGQHIQKLES